LCARDFLNFNANCVFCVSARDFSPRFTTLYAVLLRRARNGKAFWNFSQAGDAVGMFHGWSPPNLRKKGLIAGLFEGSNGWELRSP